MPPLPSDFNKQAQRAGKDIDAPLNEGGQTLLHLSAQNGDPAAVARLLKLRANPNQPDINGQTPLYAAVAAQNYEVVKLLLNNGASFSDEDDAGLTPLEWAITKQASVAFLEQMRERGAKLDATDSKGRGLLHAAAAANNTPVLTWLLNSRALADAPDAQGKTALHHATERGAHDAMRLLLANGADPVIRTNEIKTPLYLAAEKGDETAANILLALPDVRQTLNDFRSIVEGFSPLMIAVSNGHVALAEKLLDTGAYINEVDNKNRHSLFLAVEQGTPEMVRMLIRRGADVAKAPVFSDNGQTMVHRISTADYREKLLLLMEAGMDINAPDSFGATALNMVTEAYEVTKARALLELGANPDIPNNAGRRPIDRAFELLSYYEEAYTIAAALLSARANADLAPSENVQYAPLHTAARAGSVRGVKMLLDHGAALDAPDRYTGATPWLTAAGAPSAAVCELLRQKGADTTAKDKTGRSVLHYAARSGLSSLIDAALRDPAFKGQVDMQDAAGCTPLQDAAKSYRGDSARVLLAAGADPTIYDGMGNTAMHYLVRYASDAMFPIFAAAIAKNGNKKGVWNVQNLTEKQTPLHLAARDGLVSSIENLLKQDVDLDIKDIRGQTPLLAAIVSEKTWAVRALLDGLKRRKLPVDDARNNAGLGAMHLAASSQYAALPNMTVLLEAGADIDQPTPAGDTPLHIALARGRTDLIHFLVLRGADVTLANKAGVTPLDLARSLNRQDVMTTLQDAIKLRQKNLLPPPSPAQRPRPPGP